MIFGFSYKTWGPPMFEKKTGKESQYIVSRPRPNSDSPFESDRESGCDNFYFKVSIGCDSSMTIYHTLAFLLCGGSR